MLNPIAILVEHAVASIQNDASMPAGHKIKLLRACGACVSDMRQSTEFFGAANALEIAEKRQQQLWLNFGKHRSAKKTRTYGRQEEGGR